MRVADYIFSFLVEQGLDHVFMITGGGAMHLNDAVAKQPKLKAIFNHHEQACAIAAEGYYRSGSVEKMAIINVTSGPGGTNTITGVAGQWLDSIPAIYISGQVKNETTINACPELNLRQLGDQELNIVEIVKSITKYAAIVKRPQDIQEHLQKALKAAFEGRPGPVWLDIPLDVQAAICDNYVTDSEENIIKKTIEKKKSFISKKEKIDQLYKLISQAKRPVFIAGHGIKLSDSLAQFREFLNDYKIPVVTTFNGVDNLPTNHPLFMGRIGTVGNRCGNFILQNADLVISLGSRNNIRQVSYNWENFVRAGKLVVIDIDESELNKPTINPVLKIHADVGAVMKKLSNLGSYTAPNEWNEWCRDKVKHYPVVSMDQYNDKNGVQVYYFLNKFTKLVGNDAVVACGNGTACVANFQATTVLENQKIFWNSGCATMGYGLPAAIGAKFANPNKDVYCLTGDGSIQMNLQELQTVVHYNLDFKIIVLDNSGYSSIIQTQRNFFDNKFGCDKNTGVSFPNLDKIAFAYGIKYFEINKHSEIDSVIKEVNSCTEPVICRVNINPDMVFSPKLSSEKLPDGSLKSKPLEDMYPFLDRDEFKSNMIVPIIEE